MWEKSLMNKDDVKPINILLIEDNPGDARLAIEALKESKIRNNVQVLPDGEEALNYLFKKNGYEESKYPDLILLDLNLPKIDGREVLQKIKNDDKLKSIPVVILTTSNAEEDVCRSYNMHANCYITKPVDLNQFLKVIKSIENFWLTIVIYPFNNFS